jgi:hypothetical protein
MLGTLYALIAPCSLRSPAVLAGSVLDDLLASVR